MCSICRNMYVTFKLFHYENDSVKQTVSEYRHKLYPFKQLLPRIFIFISFWRRRVKDEDGGGQHFYNSAAKTEGNNYLQNIRNQEKILISKFYDNDVHRFLFFYFIASKYPKKETVLRKYKVSNN